ncbi:hypothetical protein ACVWWN_007695 [Mycobacterium sp. URHB0021]|jgi:hypothetical protein
MNAGTSTIRTSVAATRTTSASPSPNIRMNETWAAVYAAKDIDMMSAAAVMIRPVWPMPCATVSSLRT